MAIWGYFLLFPVTDFVAMTILVLMPQHWVSHLLLIQVTEEKRKESNRIDRTEKNCFPNSGPLHKLLPLLVSTCPVLFIFTLSLNDLSLGAPSARQPKQDTLCSRDTCYFHLRIRGTFWWHSIQPSSTWAMQLFTCRAGRTQCLLSRGQTTPVSQTETAGFIGYALEKMNWSTTQSQVLKLSRTKQTIYLQWERPTQVGCGQTDPSGLVGRGLNGYRLLGGDLATHITRQFHFEDYGSQK